jgi:phosphatidylglycerophosphatase A
MNLKTDATQQKPHVPLAIATGLGLGYLPKAPGTWGSLLGVVMAWGALLASSEQPAAGLFPLAISWFDFLLIEAGLIVVVSLLGLWASGRVASHLGRHDPSIVVVDEIAGQLIAYLGLATSATFALNWKYLLAGLILFRVFDIWKPFPARLAESFPGGVGIMADDWIAGLYAAFALGLARQLGL